MVPAIATFFPQRRAADVWVFESYASSHCSHVWRRGLCGGQSSGGRAWSGAVQKRDCSYSWVRIAQTVWPKKCHLLLERASYTRSSTARDWWTKVRRMPGGGISRMVCAQADAQRQISFELCFNTCIKYQNLSVSLVACVLCRQRRCVDREGKKTTLVVVGKGENATLLSIEVLRALALSSLSSASLSL